MASSERTWFVDSSVLLRAIADRSTAARTWFESAYNAGDRFVGSRILELEVLRVVTNAGLALDVAHEYLDEFALVAVGDDLVDEAIALEPGLGGADSLHIAAALRLGIGSVTLVTHDAQMARAALALGFTVLDPVTDDPNRGPVA
ncbi:MAG: type II toxin-antitoxin system VapC family toxin [Propionibacteriaceae bacterium]|nr:type II toxin-antitoxin system VapC family toxin [Propionibacteriaceae bacterium]